MDFEASIAENRFTIKANVHPAIDESMCLNIGFIHDVKPLCFEHVSVSYYSV